MIYPAINVLEEEAFQKLLKIISDLEIDLVHADFADGSWLAKPSFC